LAELVGLAIALALTVFLTRYSATELNWAGRFSAVLTNFVVAIPLLLLFSAHGGICMTFFAMGRTPN
jgi:hypothetical protein